MSIHKIITANVDKDSNERVVTFSEYMKDSDHSSNYTVCRRFRELFPDHTSYNILSIWVEVVNHNDETGNESVVTRFRVL